MQDFKKLNIKDLPKTWRILNNSDVVFMFNLYFLEKFGTVQKYKCNISYYSIAMSKFLENYTLKNQRPLTEMGENLISSTWQHLIQRDWNTQIIVCFYLPKMERRKMWKRFEILQQFTIFYLVIGNWINSSVYTWSEWIQVIITWTN